MDTILVVGDAIRLHEFQERTQHIDADFQFIGIFDELPELDQVELIFDLNLDETPARLLKYAVYPHLKVVAAAVKKSLYEMVAIAVPPHTIRCQLFGINALPTFLSKPMWELSCWKPETKHELKQLFSQLSIDIQIVEDRVGMVTPRIISMIINEACYTVQEGTATQEAIDQAMRLGVNYPGGPFEWLKNIGATDIYELLVSLGYDTGDSRYKISPLLRKLYFEARNTTA